MQHILLRGLVRGMIEYLDRSIIKTNLRFLSTRPYNNWYLSANTLINNVSTVSDINMDVYLMFALYFWNLLSGIKHTIELRNFSFLKSFLFRKSFNNTFRCDKLTENSNI